MALLSFKLDQLFILLVPELVVVDVAGTFNSPNEPDFVQNSLSVWSKFVLVMIFPLRANPHPKSLVFLVSFWHHTIAIVLFKFDKLFILHLPFLIKFRHDKSG
jgi:hypothetical protein